MRIVWRETISWMRAHQPGSLLFAPVVFPLVFAQQMRRYRARRRIAAGMKRATELIERVSK